MNTTSETLAPDVGTRLDTAQVMRYEGQYALRASCCKACGQSTFPASDICPFCLSDDLQDLPLEGAATLYAFTRIHAAPAMWQTPYAVGYADFPNGLRLFAKLADAESPWRSGQALALKIVPSGDAYRYYFEGVAA